MLIEFLEKEARVHQQRSLIQQTNFKPTTRKEDLTDSNKNRYNQRVNIANSNVQKICSFWGEGDHVATAGPNHRNIDLLSYIRKISVFSVYTLEQIKNSGKHKNDHCQKDFVCKHSTHDKFPRKKHVLDCEKHSQSTENKQLLEEYKSKCILKNVDLPDYYEIRNYHTTHQIQFTLVARAINQSIRQIQLQLYMIKLSIFYKL